MFTQAFALLPIPDVAFLSSVSDQMMLKASDSCSKVDIPFMKDC